MAINSIVNSAGLLGNIGGSKASSGDGAFAGLINQAKQAGNEYEQAVSGKNAIGDENDFITALAALETNLTVVNRVTQELLAMFKEVSHINV
jgi:hypothetical protein